MTTRPKTTVAAVLMLAVLAVAPSAVHATTYACRPGVTNKIYAFRYLPLDRIDAADLHAALETYGERAGMNVSGGGAEDPAKTQPYISRETLLQTKDYGLVISIETSNHSRYAYVTIGNNCWAPSERWRPVWVKLQDRLDALGRGRTK